MKGILQKIRKRDWFVRIAHFMLVAVIPLSIWFAYFIGTMMDEHIYETVENAADLCADMIERQYKNDYLLMESLAMRMSQSLEEDPMLAMERLVSTAERYEMKRISFADATGKNITTDGLETNISDVDSYQKSMQGETVLTSVIADVFDGEEVHVYSVPVYRVGTEDVIGVMSAVYYKETFEKLLSVTAFDGEGYTYIINKNGDVVIDTEHHNAVLGLNNVFAYLEEEEKNFVSLQEAKENIKNNGNGFFTVHGPQGNKIACYMPLEVNDWYVVSIVPEKIAEKTKHMVMAWIIVFCMGISLVSIFAVLSMYLSQKEKKRLLTEALYVDELTGGRTFAKFCIDSKERMERHRYKKVACAFLDLDNFHLLSTLYGNEENDDSIRRVYNLIQDCVGDMGIVSRNNSDQFCVMYFYDEPQELEDSIKRFIKSLRSNAKFSHMLRPSLGVYVVEDKNESISEMVNKARTAHETVKQNSKSIVAYYDEVSRNSMYEDKNLENQMEEALDNEEFVPYLQPKFDAVNGSLCGAEALIRWIPQEGTVISPAKFIPLAENNGFIRQLDRAMFAMVCRIQKYFIEQGMQPVPISVNVSRQLMYDNSFAKDYYEVIKQMGLTTDVVELEITESTFFEDFDLFRSTIDELRGYGFRILMDDFGTGYSSLMMLKTVPIDEIKLDKTFVDDYNDEKGGYIISCVLELAKALKLPVIAEGVETENQYVYLREMGCDAIQGYYFARPMPVEEFVQRMRSNA